MTYAACLDFRFLKSRVPIERVLEVRGLLKAMRLHGDNLIGPCPIHRGDSTTAFVVTRNKNLWHCFAGCRRGGDVIDLVRRLDECDYRSTAVYFASLAGTTTMARGDEIPFRPFTSRLKLDPTVTFLANKGIRENTARSFEGHRAVLRARSTAHALAPHPPHARRRPRWTDSIARNPPALPKCRGRCGRTTRGL